MWDLHLGAIKFLIKVNTKSNALSEILIFFNFQLVSVARKTVLSSIVWFCFHALTKSKA